MAPFFNLQLLSGRTAFALVWPPITQLSPALLGPTPSALLEQMDLTI